MRFIGSRSTGSCLSVSDLTEVGRLDLLLWADDGSCHAAPVQIPGTSSSSAVSLRRFVVKRRGEIVYSGYRQYIVTFQSLQF
jgi:hypothetical protein